MKGSLLARNAIYLGLGFFSITHVAHRNFAWLHATTAKSADLASQARTLRERKEAHKRERKSFKEWIVVFYLKKLL